MRKKAGANHGSFTSGTGVPMAKPVKKHVGYLPTQGCTVPLREKIYSLVEQNHYLQATLLLELDGSNRTDKQADLFLTEVRGRIPQVCDIVTNMVKEKTFREVNTSQGKEALKDQLRTKINEILHRGELKHVLFTSYAVN